MNEYQKQVLEARKKFLKLTLEQEKELLSIYEEAGKQVSKKISKAKEGSLNQRYLNELDKSIKEYTSELRLKLGMSIKDGILASAQIAANTQAAYFDAMGLNKDLNFSFRKMFSQLPTNVLKTLINGNYYSDGKSLDQRIWDLTSKNAKDIDRLVKLNVAQGANARDLAKQLDNYINPNKKINSKPVYVTNDKGKQVKLPPPSGISYNISYQAQRLARTSLAHASTEAYIQGAEKNPFCTGLKWNLSSSHYERQVKRWGPDICDTYAGKVFKPKEYPVGHPNCLCYSTQEVEDIEKSRDELIRWVKGESNPKLDKWYEQNKNAENQSNVIPIKKETKWSDVKSKDTQFKDKKEIKNHLKENYNIKFSDSTKYPIHKDILQDSVNWLDKFHNYFKGFKEIDPVELPAIKVKAGIKPVGYYEYYPSKPQAVELVLNGAYFTDIGYNNSYIEQCIESKWTVANAKSYKTFVHEYGHHIADSLKWLDKGTGPVNQNWCKDFMNDTIKEYNEQYGRSISFKDIADLVSRYGGTKPEEAFAETFAEYFGGDNPRDFAKIFGESVEKKLKEYIKLKG